MEKRLSKKEIVKMLLRNNELEEKDEEELLDLLVDQPISIDVDKQDAIVEIEKLVYNNFKQQGWSEQDFVSII